MVQRELLGQRARTAHSGQARQTPSHLRAINQGKTMKTLMKKVGGNGHGRKKARFWNMAHLQPRRWHREQAQASATPTPGESSNPPILPSSNPSPSESSDPA